MSTPLLDRSPVLTRPLGGVIIALDPGPTQTAILQYGGKSLVLAVLLPNPAVRETLRWVREEYPDARLAVEMIACYGMPAGRELFETCLWIGRFIEAWGGSYRLVYRLECKLHLCKDSRAKDANLRRALLDRFGEKGTKADPGQLYGFKSHLFAALAVALTAAETPGEWRDG